MGATTATTMMFFASTPAPQQCASPRPQRKLFSTAPRRLCSTSICAAASTQGLKGGRPQRRLFSTAPRRLFSTSICAADLHQGLNGGFHERAPYPTFTTSVDGHVHTTLKEDHIPTEPAVFPVVIAVNDSRFSLRVERVNDCRKGDVPPVARRILNLPAHVQTFRLCSGVNRLCSAAGSRLHVNPCIGSRLCSAAGIGAAWPERHWLCEWCR